MCEKVRERISDEVEDMVIGLMNEITDLKADVKRLRKIAELITSIYYYSNFVAETASERDLEKLLREAWLWPTTENIIVARRQAEEKE